MRNVLKGVAVAMLAAAIAVTGFAATENQSAGGGDDTKTNVTTTKSSGGGGGNAVSTGITIYSDGSSTTVQGATSGPAPTQVPVTAVNPSNGGAAVDGSWSVVNGAWRLSAGGHQYASEWVNATNPYAGGAAQWFYFDAAGNMVVGWQWILGTDGQYHCYYFNPVSNGSLGQAQLGGTTPDGYTVNAAGQWTVEGVAQTR